MLGCSDHSVFWENEKGSHEYRCKKVLIRPYIFVFTKCDLSVSKKLRLYADLETVQENCEKLAHWKVMEQ